MKPRFASIIFGAAVLAGLTSIWIAFTRTEPHDKSSLLEMPAADLNGVVRVVFDVDSSYETQSYSSTMVLAGWQGDLRLRTEEGRKYSTPLRFIREGNTVYVRVKEDASSHTEKDTRDGTDHTGRRYIDSPMSLALPASIKELTWPKMQLQMASAANMPALTVRSPDITVGASERRDRYEHYQESHMDAQVVADLKRDVIPGTVKHLTVTQPQDKDGGCSSCASKTGQRNSRSGKFYYEGGFFPKITLYAPNGKISVNTMEPDMQLVLHTTADTSLDIHRLSYLKQIQIKDLSADDAKKLDLSVTPEEDEQTCRR